MSIGPWAGPINDGSCWRQRIELYHDCSASANDCGAYIALSSVVDAQRSLRAAATNEQPVFASCRECSWSSMKQVIARFHELERFCLDLVTHAIGSHKQ